MRDDAGLDAFTGQARAAGNPKSEGRSPKEGRNPKSEGSSAARSNGSSMTWCAAGCQASAPRAPPPCRGSASGCLRLSDFGLPSDFGFRHFGIWGRRPSLLCLLLPSCTQKPVSDLQCYPPAINLSGAQARQRIVVQAGYADGVTCDVTAQARCTIADRRLARFEQGAVCATRRRQDGAAGHLRWPHAHGAGHGLGRRHATAHQLQARRDAGVHEGRLQRGRLPRHVARQGRLPPLAVRLRPGWRLFPAHPRTDWPARQPRAARGEPDCAERPGRGAAHRRRALRDQQRALPDPGGLAHRGRAE